MRGSIIKRSENSYTIILNLGRDLMTGKRRQQWVTVKGKKKDADKRLSELLHQLDTGVFVAPGKTTVKDYLDRWLRDYARSNISPRGLDRYTDIINKHFVPQFGSLPLTGLKPEHIQKHYTECQNRSLSPGTIRCHHAVLHKALKTAMEWGLLSRNVADAVRPPRSTHKEMQVWSETEVNEFLESAKDSPYFTLFFTALYTGARRSELLALTWRDVDLIMGEISVKRGLQQLRNGDYVYCQPKSTNSRRAIALPPTAIIQLRLYREQQKLQCSTLDIPFTDDRLVFCHFDGKPLRPNSITRAWTVMAAHAGVKVIRLHDARHTHASLMLKQGIHPKIVQERLGHSSIKITLDTYSHVAPGLQEAAARRFDELLNPDTANKAVKVTG